VLAAVDFPSASVFFHDEDVYPERTGFWVRGEATAVMTVAPHQAGDGVTLRIHGGAQANTVELATTTWGSRVIVAADQSTEVQVPPPARPGPFLLRVTSKGGFVPASVMPGNSDHRMLGCWIDLVQ
jgi:hypothetical protein